MKKTACLGLSVLLISALVILSGCGDAGGLANRRSPVYVLIKGITPPFVNSDVCNSIGTEGSCVCSFDDEAVELTMQVKTVNFGADDPADPADTRYLDVIVDRYKISYFRNDTGGAVPATFTEYASYYLPADGGDTDISVRILRAEQKNMIPLLYLNNCDSFGYEPDTGLDTINCTVDITFYGKTVSGHSLTWGCQVPVTFTDFGGEEN